MYNNFHYQVFQFFKNHLVCSWYVHIYMSNVSDDGNVNNGRRSTADENKQ